MTIRVFVPRDSTALAPGMDDVAAFFDAGFHQGESGHAPSFALAEEIPYLKKQERLTLARDRRACASVSAWMQSGVVYTTFHFQKSGADIVATDNSDWAANCLEYNVTAMQLKRTAEHAA